MKKEIVGYIVEHNEGVMGLGTGYRKIEVLYMSPLSVTLFPNRRAANRAIQITVRERGLWLKEYCKANPDFIESDVFTKPNQFHVRRVTAK